MTYEGKAQNKVANNSAVQGAAISDQELSKTVAFKPFENSIYELRGLLSMLDDLALIERALFRGKEGTISSKAKDFSTSSIIAIFEELEKTGLEPYTERQQLKFLKDLIAYLKTLPTVKVTFAFAPTTTFVQKISNDISNVLGKKALLDITVDQFIVGGALFEFQGKTSGMILKEKLEEVLFKKLGAINERF